MLNHPLSTNTSMDGAERAEQSGCRQCVAALIRSHRQRGCGAAGGAKEACWWSDGGCNCRGLLATAAVVCMVVFLVTTQMARHYYD